MQMTPAGLGLLDRDDEEHRHGARDRSTGCTCASSDIEAARAELVARGVDASELSTSGPRDSSPGWIPSARTYNTFLSFKDPDGNTWLVQEVRREALGA